ncbi:MAG: hypothetical protein V3U11_04240 [Planctomycetota bacterium]
MPDGPPSPIWLAGAANGPVHQLQAQVDLAGLADLFRAAQAARPTRNSK